MVTETDPLLLYLSAFTPISDSGFYLLRLVRITLHIVPVNERNQKLQQCSCPRSQDHQERTG